MNELSSKYDPREKIRIISERLFKTRPRAEIVMRPYMKNRSQYMERIFFASPEQVDLRKIFPAAEEGTICFVSFYISSATEDDGYIRISRDVDVYLNGKRVYSCSQSEEEYAMIPIHVSENRQKVDIKCYCRKDGFFFEYMLSSKVYRTMWAVDYLLHIRRTLPVAEYKEEEGIAVSQLYPAWTEPGDDIKYVFPESTKGSYKKDFYMICAASKGYIGYAYAEVEKKGTLRIRNHSPIKVFVNGKAILEKQEEGELVLEVAAEDRLLLKTVRRKDKWGFSCTDELLKVPVILSDRIQGDRWLLLGAFGTTPAISSAYGPEFDLSFEKVYFDATGEKIFWRLADGSYVRPYLDSFFFGQWFYALMLGHWGILKAANVMDEPQWQKYFVDSIGILGHWFEYMEYDYEQLKVMTPFLQRSLTLDHMDPLGTMGMNLSDLYFLTGDARVKNTVYSLRDALYQQVPRMENGIINRKATIWADDLFMSVPFLVRLGVMFRDMDYIRDAFLQIQDYSDKLYIKEEKIFSHIFYVRDYEKNNIPWGRGNGWVMLAMCEYLDYAPAVDENRKTVIAMYRDFVEGVCALQGESGMWHQVLNRFDTYEETSCTAMFLYSMIRGVKLGILSKEKTAPVIRKAYQALCNQAIDEQGNIRGVCKGSGFSKDWRDYAKLGTVKNDDHGTGIALAAISEYADF